MKDSFLLRWNLISMNDINYLLMNVAMYLTNLKEIYKKLKTLHATEPQAISKVRKIVQNFYTNG